MSWLARGIVTGSGNVWMVRGTVWQTVKGSGNEWMVRMTVWQTVKGSGNV